MKTTHLLLSACFALSFPLGAQADDPDLIVTDWPGFDADVSHPCAQVVPNKYHKAAVLVTNIGYGHANAAGMALIDPAVLDAADLGPIDGPTLPQLPFDLAQRERQLETFEQIKVGFQADPGQDEGPR